MVKITCKNPKSLWKRLEDIANCPSYDGVDITSFELTEGKLTGVEMITKRVKYK